MLFCKLGIHNYKIEKKEHEDIYTCQRDGCDRVVVMKHKHIPECGCEVHNSDDYYD